MRFLITVLFLTVFSFHFAPFANATQCLPTCSTTDGRFLAIAGINLSTIVGAEIVVNIVSKGENLEFGIFDGEAGGNWDFAPTPERLHVKYELHVDPTGDSSGLAGPVIATWTGDGSGGLNSGVPMNNNGWSDFTFSNVPQAQAPNGDFIYTLRISPIDPGMLGNTENVFKVRATDELYVPAMVPVTFIVPFGGQETIEFFQEDILTLYPNATIEEVMGGLSVCGFPPGEFCDFNDPTCCLFKTTYNGMWSFTMQVPTGLTALDVWDGDLDYGDFDGTVFDTDDPNTPGDPFLPPWSIGTDVVFETARPADPHDNNGSSSEFIFVRDPDIQYFVIDPNGVQYQNFNPSGDREWELFRLDTLTDNPTVAEYQVDSIPGGIWEVKLVGVDMSNLNSMLLPYDLRGEEIGDPRNVPTLNEWGLIAMAVILGIVGFMVIRRREVTV